MTSGRLSFHHRINCSYISLFSYETRVHASQKSCFLFPAQSLFCRFHSCSLSPESHCVETALLVRLFEYHQHSAAASFFVPKLAFYYFSQYGIRSAPPSTAFFVRNITKKRLGKCDQGRIEQFLSPATHSILSSPLSLPILRSFRSHKILFASYACAFPHSTFGHINRLYRLTDPTCNRQRFSSNTNHGQETEEHVF